jgi:hypothetical protein
VKSNENERDPILKINDMPFGGSFMLSSGAGYLNNPNTDQKTAISTEMPRECYINQPLYILMTLAVFFWSPDHRSVALRTLSEERVTVVNIIHMIVKSIEG